MGMKFGMNQLGALALGTASAVAAYLVMACAPSGKDTDRGAAPGDATPATTPVEAASAPARGDARPTVLFIGTSLTAGFGLQPDQAYPTLVERLADSAGMPIRAVNAGVSGETSAGALHRIDWVLRTPADVIVIETGANDALRALPVTEARANIARILEKARHDRPRARLLLVQMEAPPNLGPAYTTAFHAMYGELARQYGATLVPFLLNGVAGHAELNQGDGVHPNAVGERIVAANVWRALEPVIQVARSAPAA